MEPVVELLDSLRSLCIECLRNTGIDNDVDVGPKSIMFTQIYANGDRLAHPTKY